MEQSTRKLPAPAVDPSAAALIAPGTGSALYVINLCASMAPIANGDKPLPGFEQYRVYQVSRKEDGRVRYRLRLGFFADEAEAETALACIREHYPTAFAASLCDEDQRHTRGFESNARPAVAPVAAPSEAPATVAPQAATATAKKPVAAATTAVKSAPPTQALTVAATPGKTSAPPPVKPPVPPSNTQPVQAQKPTRPLQIEVEWEPAGAPVAPTAAAQPTPPAAAPRALQTELSLAADPVVKQASAAGSSTSSNEPFHVGKGVTIPASTLALALEPEPAAAKASEPASTPAVAATTAPPRSTKQGVAATPAKPSPAAPAPATRKPPLTKPAETGTQPAPAKAPASVLPKPPQVLGDDAPPPDFDSTQTIRALTAAELDDESQPKWFAVQLAVSDQPINLDTMPHLDIFSAYRLYSVATAGSGKILHHMRIGFFKEAVSAEAVSGYLKTFFANPTVLRISVAEHTRFSEAPPKPAVVETKAKVIDLATARDRTPSQEVPVITMEVTPSPSASGRYPKPDTNASGVHKQPPAAKTAARSATASRAAKKPTSSSASGKHRTLQEALLAEAREVALSESAIRRLPKNSSLFSKLFGKK